MTTVATTADDAAVRAPRRGAVVVGRQVGALALAAAAVLAALATPVVEHRATSHALDADLAWDLSWLSYVVVGGVVASRRADLRVGLVLVGCGASVEVAGLVTAAAESSVGALRAWLAWLAVLLYGCYAVLVGVLLPAHLPDGRVEQGRSRWLLRTGCGAWAVWLAALLLVPGPLDTAPVANPLGWSTASAVVHVVRVAAAGLLAAVAVLSYGRLLTLWRRAAAVRRRALAFLALGGLVTLVVAVSAVVLPAVDVPGPSWLTPVGVVLYVVSIPVSVGLAILRARLLDIELVLRRTLTYLVMTVVVLAVYALTVGLVGDATGRLAGLSTSLLVTALAAVGLSPLRERAQRQVDRLLYGRRADPYGVLRELDTAVGRARTPAEVLPAVTGTIAAALRLPYVTVVPSVGAEVAHGDPAPVARELSLHHHGQQVGMLRLAARSPGERFSALDDRLLGEVADHTGSAVAAVTLAHDAQRSREMLVRALEEDRRRIRRDLHDHLGPVLSGITLQLDALRRMVGADVEAGALAGTIRDEVAEAVVDVRRLVHGLRPPVLDEVGLVDAVRHHAATVSERLPVTVVAEDLPPLPAAVEVAAYRIVTEALTNALRHAAASRVTVRLGWAGDRLDVDVSDDGRGMVAGTARGIGLTSMRERTAELGGVLDIQDAGPGTTVHAELPA